MSFRLFEGKSHANAYRQFRQQPPKHVIQRIVTFLQDKCSKSLDQAVDLGCGTGQCTFLLAEHFANILGTDISESQIHEANVEVQSLDIKNVSFLVAPAEKIPMEDNKAQLITICTAVHWMDLPKVFAEAKRVLCPQGVLALLCYDVAELSISLEKDPSKNEELKKHLNWIWEFMRDNLAQPALLVLNKYKDIEIPSTFSDITREFNFKEDKAVSLSRIVGYIKSMSPYQTYCKEHGEEAGKEFLMKVQNGYLNITGLKEDELDSPAFIQTDVYFLLMARA